MDDDLLREFDAVVGSDTDWQRRARLMQSMWRAEQGLLPGPRSATDPAPLGSRLLLPDAAPRREGGTGAMRNYLSSAAREEVLWTVASNRATVLARPRLWVDLLAAHPLCFNLFAPLATDLRLASTVFAELFPARVSRVSKVRFDQSPGVLLSYDGPRGPGVLGVEVAYHQDLTGVAPADRLARMRAAAVTTRAFRPAALPRLARPTLLPLWSAHLNVLGTGEDALFVLLHPAANLAAMGAAAAYAATLSPAGSSTFTTVTLESFLEAVGPKVWARDLRARYLNPGVLSLGSPAL